MPNQSPRGAPGFVKKDPTKRLISELRSAEYTSLPLESRDASYSLHALNVFYRASLEAHANITFYDRYAPIVTITPVRGNTSVDDLPPEMRVKLSDSEAKLADHLREASNSEFAEYYGALTANSIKLVPDEVQVFLGRVGTHWEIARIDPLDIARAAKSITTGFVGLSLDLGVYTLQDAKSRNSVITRTVLSCSAFVLTASTTSLSAPIGIGLIGMISTVSTMVECADNLRHLTSMLSSELETRSKERRIAEASSGNDKADLEVRGPHFELTKNGKPVDSFTSTDTKQDSGTLYEPGGAVRGRWECRDVFGDGMIRETICDRIGPRGEILETIHKIDPSSGQKTIEYH